MRIIALTLLSKNIHAQRHFYHDVLNLPIIDETANRLAVQIGTTVLHLEQSEHHQPYHYAFNILEHQIAEGEAYLRERDIIPMQNPTVPGRVTFTGSSRWNSHGLYFPDADGNILEFIARHDIPSDTTTTDFTVDSILNISEIGLGVPQVLRTSQFLQQELSMDVYSGYGSETFTAMGDEHGLLILVPNGRIWMPTEGTIHECRAYPVKTKIQVAGLQKVLQLPDLPYFLEPA
ncbi:MAG: VOC family protein [Aggregatilineales bacterium]